MISAINQGQIYRYITKPWEPEEFLGTVQQSIEVFEMKDTIARQNRELQKANEELLGLDKMKSDFMVLVNHELKTPLTGIFSFVQLLGEEKLSDDQKIYIEKISKNTQRLQDLINDTLLITRLQANKEEITMEELNIEDVVKAQWNEIKKLFPNKSMSLKLEAEKNFSQVVNTKYISMIFKKLLHNCYAHGKDSSEVNIALKDASDLWEMNLTNESEKPVEKTAEELLSAFSTSGNILNHAGGTGLGLAVIQAIVNLFGGKIEISTENKQFNIKIFIPKDN